MTACKYWDCGWCYAPNYLKTNSINSACVDPNKCPMSPLSEPVQYETPMTEIEELKAQIKVLEKKLSFLEELEKTKSPAEEAYKDWWGEYPKTVTASNTDDARWFGFQAGYNAAYEEKVCGEPSKDVVSLYKRFENEGAYGQLYYDDALKVVKEFLMDEGFIEDESGEYITFTLQKSLLEIPND